MMIAVKIQRQPKIQLYKALRKPTILHFDNGGKYGKDFQEIKIHCSNGSFMVISTDGYKDYVRSVQPSLKSAISYGKQVLAA